MKLEEHWLCEVHIVEKGSVNVVDLQQIDSERVNKSIQAYMELCIEIALVSLYVQHNILHFCAINTTLMDYHKTLHLYCVQ